MRLFAAIRPPAPVLEHLDRALDAVRGPLGLRFVTSEQWHITVAFYGEIPNAAMADATHALRTAAAVTPPLTLALRGAGSFGGRNVWMGIGGDTARLKHLMTSSAIGEERRKRHRGHLTVARVRDDDVDVRSVVHALAVYEGPAWVATEVEVIESTLGAGKGGRPLHNVVDVVALAG